MDGNIQETEDFSTVKEKLVENFSLSLLQQIKTALQYRFPAV